MHRWKLATAAALMAFTLILPGTALAAPQAEDPGDAPAHLELEGCTGPLKLTDAQKSRMDQLLDRYAVDSKALYEAYAEYGAITSAQKEHYSRMVDKYLTYVKSHGYAWCREVEHDDD